MGEVYDEVEIEDMEYDAVASQYTYPCPCGDEFRITLADLWAGEEIAHCASCSLLIRVIYDTDALPALPNSDEPAEGAASSLADVSVSA